MLRNCIAAAVVAAAALTHQSTPVFAQTPTASSTPSATPSVGSSPSPSPSPRAQPYGIIRDIAILDCNGGLHLLPGHPLEMNVNLRGARQVFNAFAEEIRQHALCTANRPVSSGPLCPQLTEEHILRHFVPSVPMLLNFVEPLRTRRHLPEECMTHNDIDPDNSLPAFARTFWDDSAMSTVFANLYNFTRLPMFLNMPETCTYDSYMGGVGCKFNFNEPVSYTNFQVGIDKCPNSYVPYVSVTCRGPWCANVFRPCLPSSDCGNSGLICRNLEPEGSPSSQNTLASWLINLNLAKNKAELDSCKDPISGQMGLPQLAGKLRNKLFSLYNQTIPVSFSDDLNFCLPTDQDWSDMKNRMEKNFNEYWETDLTKDPSVKAETKNCLATECDLLLVGDGTCNLQCMNAACKWDGGDCGGPPVKDFTSTYVDSSLVGDVCTIQTSELTSDNSRYSNVWERCNGQGSCLPLAGICTCSPTCIKAVHVPPFIDNGNKCQNCDVVYGCIPPFLPGTCRFQSRHLIGLQDRMQPWDGLLYDGSSVFDFDRKTGINFTTPAASFETVSVLGPYARSVFQFTCAGEIGATFGNGFLQLGFHAPWLQDVAGFLGGWVADLAQCRAALPQFGSSTLTPVQVETRFMAHHPAFWFYQFFYLHSLSDVNWNNVDNWGSGYNTLATRPAAGAGGAAFAGFGRNDLVDPLMNTGLRREPAFPAPTPGLQSFYLQGTDWSKQFRMFPPNVDGSGADCDWVSSADFLGGRRCRGTFDKFGTLFSDRISIPQLHNVYFDIRLDRGYNNPVCADAITGQKNPAAPSYMPAWATPYPSPTLSAATAANAFPAFSIVYDGVGIPVADSPIPCKSDSDCAARFSSGSAYCVDLDKDLLNIPGIYNKRNVDPFGRFIYGMYNVDRVTNVQNVLNRDTCSSRQGVDVALRQFLNNIGGRQRDAGTDAKFCFMKPDSAANQQNWNTWKDSVYVNGTCDLTLDYFDVRRNCLLTRSVAEVKPFFNGYSPGKPAKVNGFSAPLGDFIVPITQSGIMPFQPNNRYPNTFPGGGRIPYLYYLSLPVLKRSRVTNQLRETFRWAIATAMAQFGMGITPDNILITSVEDNPQGFAPLPDGSRAGITIGFVIEAPDLSKIGNITASLRSTQMGTLGGQAGAVFATLGIVPFRFQREVVFAIRPPIGTPEEPLSGGIIFLIILIVGVVIGFTAYFVRGGTVAGLISLGNSLADSFMSLVSGATGRARGGSSMGGGTKKKSGSSGLGEVVGHHNENEATRKSSSVEALNPIMLDGILSGTTSANGAPTVPGSAADRAHVVNVLRAANAAPPGVGGATVTTVTTTTTTGAVPTNTPSSMYVSAKQASTMPAPSAPSGAPVAYHPTPVYTTSTTTAAAAPTMMMMPTTATTTTATMSMPTTAMPPAVPNPFMQQQQQQPTAYPPQPTAHHPQYPGGPTM